MYSTLVVLIVALAFAQPKSECDACVEATRHHCKDIIGGNMEGLATAPDSCTKSRIDCMPFLLRACSGDHKVDCEGHFEELSVHCDKILAEEFSGPIPEGFSPLCIPEIMQKCADMKKDPCASVTCEKEPECPKGHELSCDKGECCSTCKCVDPCDSVDCKKAPECKKGEELMERKAGCCTEYFCVDPCATCVKEVVSVCDELKIGNFDVMPQSCTEKCVPKIQAACAANVDCDLCANVVKGKDLCKDFLSNNMNGPPPKECDVKCLPEIVAKCSSKKEEPKKEEPKKEPKKEPTTPTKCECAASWSSPEDGKGCLNQSGCAKCDDDSDSWCMVKTENCLEAEKPDGDWFYCDSDTKEGATGCCGTDNCSKDLFEKETQELCEKCLHSQQCRGFQAAYEKRTNPNRASGSVFCCPDAKRCVDLDNQVACPPDQKSAQCGRYAAGKCGGRMTTKPNYPFNCVGCKYTNWIQDWISDLEVTCKSTIEVAAVVNRGSDIYMILIGGLVIFNIATFSYLQWQKKRDSSYVVLLEETE